MSYPSYPGGAGGYPAQPGGGYPPAGTGGYPTQQPQPGYPSQPGYPAPGGGAPGGYPGQPAPYPSSAPPAAHAAPIGFAGAAAAVTAFRAPPAGGSAPYPGQPAAGGYPPSGSAPYPGGPGGAPMPSAGGAPYPGAPPPAAAPYPGGAPPPHGGAAPAPYPSGPGGPPAAHAPYPGAGPPAGSAPYPGAPAPASSPYPSSGGPPQPGSGGAPPYGAPVAQPAAVPSAQPPTAAMAGMSVGRPAAPAAQPQAGPRRRPSVKAASNFSKEEDAQTLRKAMKGFGCDEKAIIMTLSRRSVAQRVEIRNHFKTMFGKDLMKEIESELHGHLEAAVLALLRDPTEYDCFSLYYAMKGAGTNEGVLIEILCSRSNAQKEAIKAQYKKMYSKDLEKAIKSETSGHFERLLVSLLSATRDESGTTDLAKAKADAQTLYKAGEARWGTDESTFNYIFASRSFAQLRLVFEEYSKVCKYDIEKSIQREMSGDLKDGMMAIVQIVRDTPGFFAQRLYKSMKGLGTDDTTLVRVIVTRCEVDMEDIKVRFQQEYKKSLRSFIEGDTSGNYRRILLTLINDGGY
ncbi:annexin-B12-like isoform X2 [Sycon ciliatum]|uniref:annexin-B12-like isoform X2 n=1 Tax=Sycon ciliatum TaxID=27933 RepID=UPI0020A88EE9|eukprot:scpid57281/ scgid26080/ Annexin A7; Annexin VII; Annexin-7; Synexin